MKILMAALIVLGLVGCGEEEPERCDTDECTLTCVMENEGDVGHCEFMDEYTSYCWCSWRYEDENGA